MTRRYTYVILTYIIMQFSVLLMAPLITSIFGVNLALASIYWSVFSFTLGLVIVLWLLKPDMQVRAHPDAVGIGGIIVWSVLGIIMALLSQGLAATIEMELFGIDPGSENTQGIMNMARAVPIFIVLPAILAPILEEIIFRKIIFGSLYKKMNFFFAALISSLIFAVIHTDFLHILVYAAMGFVFAFLYVQTKRILVPIIVHAGMNTLVVLAQLSLDPEEIQKRLDQLQLIFFGG
ncbi:peptidase [Oceanobacillus oncorhynchi subsp. incaldanensis]|uniref:CAAX amino terminal protease self-immunity n=2 Tax=Oceanobacillus TaxID=182709 RepID=A0A0A1MSN6_9BACI|nr:type II CAAX endopeptidase family protein [Oceanobacillus oncorhynchi]GIO19268.1 peptidase [Oceanobacillus oncorhynchi subsp. incaldanensis]CEI82592.1 CAAX amino terminal protease self-immunity [Oceanobacillus oncorhynchi]